MGISAFIAAARASARFSDVEFVVEYVFNVVALCASGLWLHLNTGGQSR